jgi:hypothetical protein
MRSFTRKGLVCTVALFTLYSTLHAQYSVPKHEFGLTAGMFIYQGDLTPEKAGAFKSPSLTVNLFYNRLLSRSFSLRTNLAVGRLTASDANYDHPEWRTQRALRFKTRVTELSELLVWNILGNNYSGRYNLSPYIFGGVGISSLRIRRDWSQFNPDYFAAETKTLEGLGTDTTHRMPTVIPVIPVGAGLRMAISPRLSVMAEASYRFTFTDYLDGFSQVANPNKKDYYSSYSVGLIYTLGTANTLKCPPMRY